MRITKQQKEGVLREDLDSKLDVILEQNSELLKLKPAIEKMADDIKLLKTDVAVMKVGQASLQQDMDIVKSDIREIKHDLKKKADKSEVDALMHQVAKFA